MAEQATPSNEAVHSETSALPTGKAVLIGKTMLEGEIAEAFGVSLSTIRKLRYDGKIPYVKIGGGKPIYLVDSIIDWLHQNEIRENMNPTSIEVEEPWRKIGESE